MNVNERANLARARLIYYAALATGKLTDPLSVKRLQEMRSLSDPPRRSRLISSQRLRELVRESLHRYRRGPARLSVPRRETSKFDPLKHPRLAKGQRGAGQFCKSDQQEADGPTPEPTPSKPTIDVSTLPPLSHKWQGRGTTGWDISAFEDQHDDIHYQARYVGIAHGRMQYTFRRYSLGKLVVVKHDNRELKFVERNGKYLTRDHVRYIAANSPMLLDEDDWDSWFQNAGADSTESLIPKRPKAVPITWTEEWRRAHERNTPERKIEPPAEPPPQPGAHNAQKPAELNGLKATDGGNGNWVVWDRQGNRIGDYSNGTIFREIADTRGRMTAGTFSLPLSEVKKVDSWYWHSPDDDKEWDDWFIDHGRYVSQLIVPEITWEQLSAGSMATSANVGQPMSAAAVQVPPQIWALTWHVMKGVLEKYIGGRIISCVVSRGLELVITRADGRIFRIPLKDVREWGQKLLRTKDSKKAERATELIEDGFGRLRIPRAGSPASKHYIIFNKMHSKSMPSPKGLSPNGARLESHHGLQRQWAESNIPGYKSKLAPTVTIEKGRGFAHTALSDLQNKRRDARVAAGLGKWSSTIDEELQFIVDDFRKVGFDEDVIKQVLDQNFRMLDELKVTYTRPFGF